MENRSITSKVRSNNNYNNNTGNIFLVISLFLLLNVWSVDAGAHNAPVLRFSKNLMTLPNAERLQLGCVGGTAKSTNEEPNYIFCVSTEDDIFSPKAKYKCQNPNPSGSSTTSHFNVVCKRDKNDFKEYTFGDDHPCYLEYHVDWIQWNQNSLMIKGLR
ncbi:hypothetical protein PPL_09467 [Heterostelium album PN500]|uniref:Uncharacterized protein n=1 Tax=Heterostelium pallidum (strain ATCC 26659 / Pp 5 / PN500) TaxID=670386 RepID=D3BPJ8_HETP5|nr:hypothetical protein PPL_09467 [Heterostelium album PN500]EFA76716.1 hypothetical protein PPL_09467 [Heterostelium album PN500]|eukprot:XP_020428848.1 hypothetical protein PPL_09467 [Heterostelium album PN500]